MTCMPLTLLHTTPPPGPARRTSMDRDNAPGQGLGPGGAQGQGLGPGGAPKDLALGLAQPKASGQPIQRSLFLNNPPPNDKDRGNDKDRPQLSPRNPYATPLVVLPRGSHQPPKQLSPFISAGVGAPAQGQGPGGCPFDTPLEIPSSHTLTPPFPPPLLTYPRSTLSPPPPPFLPPSPYQLTHLRQLTTTN